MSKTFSWEKIYNYLDQKGLSEGSQKTTVNQMRRVLKGIFGDKPFTMAQLKKSPMQAVKWITEDGDLSSFSIKKNHLTSMFKLYEALDINTKVFCDKFAEVVDLANAERAGGLSEKQKQRFDKVDFEALQKKVETINDPEVRLMTAVYAGHMPPLRGNEWRGTKVVTTKKYTKSSLPDNYILLPQKKMIVGKSKTSKYHETKEIDLPDEVVKEIKRYVDTSKSDILFPDMASSVFTKRLMKNLGFSVQALRKRYVSEKVSEGISPTDRVALARIMGHTIATSALDYSKPDDIKKKDEDED